MGWGDAFKNAYKTAKSVAKKAVDTLSVAASTVGNAIKKLQQKPPRNLEELSNLVSESYQQAKTTQQFKNVVRGISAGVNATGESVSNAIGNAFHHLATTFSSVLPIEACQPCREVQNDQLAEEIEEKIEDAGYWGRGKVASEIINSLDDKEIFQLPKETKHELLSAVSPYFNPPSIRNNKAHARVLRLLKYDELTWFDSQFVDDNAARREINMLSAHQLKCLPFERKKALINTIFDVNISEEDKKLAERLLFHSPADQQEELSELIYGHEVKELKRDLVQFGADIVGIADPTPYTDGTNAFVYAARGKYFDAGLTLIGVIPVLGDLAKAGKFPKLAKIVSRAVQLAKKSKTFAKQLIPALKALGDALKKLPLNVVPAKARPFLNKMIDDIDSLNTSAHVYKSSDTVIMVGEYRLSARVAEHANETIQSGPFAGQLARPFISSPSLIKEIRASVKPIPDPRGAPGAVRYNSPGTFRGTQGVYELVIHESTNTIYHFNFVKVKP
jgi:hypothetical protein